MTKLAGLSPIGLKVGSFVSVDWRQSARGKACQLCLPRRARSARNEGRRRSVGHSARPREHPDYSPPGRTPLMSRRTTIQQSLRFCLVGHPQQPRACATRPEARGGSSKEISIMEIILRAALAACIFTAGLTAAIITFAIVWPLIVAEAVL